MGDNDLASSKRFFLFYLALLSIAGAVIVYLATAKQGPGVSTDAAMMLSAGENLAKGRGLVDYRGTGLAQYPPLESLLLAAGVLLFHQDVLVVGWVIGILVFAAIIWASGIYFWQAFIDEPVIAFIASFIIFSSTSLVQISSNVASDPLLLLFVVLTLMSLSAYMKRGNARMWWLAGLFTILACFERYTGLSLVITGAAVTLFAQRDNLRRGMLAAAGYAVLSGAPIFGWGLWHNRPITGELFVSPLPADPALNLLTGLEKVLHWFIPLSIVERVGAGWLSVVLIAVLLLMLFATRTLSGLRRLAAPAFAPSVAFQVVYWGVLLFTLSYVEFKHVASDRVHIILLPPLLLVLLGSLMNLLHAACKRFGTRIVYAVLLVAFAAWALYPLRQTYKYVTGSRVDGDVSAYNEFNRGDVRGSPLARKLLSLDLGGRALYSNDPAQVWFLLREISQPLPVAASGDRLASLAAHYAHWPGSGRQAYIVWFNGAAYSPSIATPQELSSIADIRQIYSDADGSIYLVTGR